MRALYIIVLPVLLAACGGTEFSGSADHGKREVARPGGKDQDAVDQGGKDDGGKPLGQVDQSSASEGDDGADLGGVAPGLLEDDGDLIACPRRPQKILILDFKSGWWAGDGGQFFAKVLRGLHEDCGGSVQIEYHHLTDGGPLGGGILGGGGGPSEVANQQIVVPGESELGIGGGTFETAFRDPSWSSYDEVWVLSGSQADPADVRVEHPFFAKVLEKARTSSANLFVGAGYGSITHANAVSRGVGIGVDVTTTQVEGALLSVMDGVEVQTTIGKDKLAKHVLFSRGAGSIADRLVVGGEVAFGDVLGVSGGMKAIAHDGNGAATIAVGNKGSRKVVVDADLPRYYAVWKDLSPGTFQLLKNLIVYLSR